MLQKELFFGKINKICLPSGLLKEIRKEPTSLEFNTGYLEHDIGADALRAYETTINTWFDDTSAVALEENSLILHCPNDFKRDTIRDRFLPNIINALKDIFSADFSVLLLDDAALAEYQRKKSGKAAVKKPSSLFETSTFTFENFVVGPSNELAFARPRRWPAATRSTTTPSLFTDSGLGKTHLIYAIAHETRIETPDSKIVYIKGDDFINEFIEMVRSGKNQDFRAKYRRATCCWWMISSLWPARRRRRTSSSTPSIPSTRRASRSSSPRTGRPRDEQAHRPASHPV